MDDDQVDVEMDEGEEEEEVVMVESDDDGDDGESGGKARQESKTVDWSDYARPRTTAPSPEDGLLRLQVIDIEHQKRRLPSGNLDDPGVKTARAAADVYKNSKHPFMPSVPCIRLYCKDMRGYSFCVNCYGYYPVVHLLVSIAVTEIVVQEMRSYVETQLIENEEKSPFQKKRPEGWQAILECKTVQGFPAFPYCEDPCTFIEFKLADACYIKPFGRLMRKNGGELENDSLGVVKVMPYSCQDIVDKFQADNGVAGFGWIELANFKKTASSSSGGGGGDESNCHFEIDTCVAWMRPVHDCDDIAPLRKITYDIECLKSKGMPDPEKDAVIVISAICGEYVGGQPIDRKRKVLLQLHQADPVKNIIPENGDRHICFNTEQELLSAFGDLVEQFDPDYLCGHNIVGFDLPYLVTRANALDADSLRYMGRRGAYKWTKPRKVIKKRKNGDIRESKMTATPGRIQLDTLTWIMNGFEKERSYRLGYLAYKHLDGDTKDDVGYSMIGPMFKQSNTTRARLGKYCLKDSELTERLCDLKEYQMVISSIEMSRQTRVPAGKLLRSGVQVKVWALMLERAKKPNFDDKGTPVFFPDEEIREIGKDVKIGGAEVLEPYRAYYEDWVGCGDFRSLYPSIIIDLNIDYCTELIGIKYKGYPFKQSPVGVKFIDKKKRLGLLPQMEVELMANRDKAKKQASAAKKAGDMGAFTMYDKRQNEIKIICNSVYGIMGASGGRLTRTELGESVTSQGRLMIMTAKGIAEDILKTTNHEKKDDPDSQFKVIYGDTDSIFILFPKWISTQEDSFKWLKVICDTVTSHFTSLEAGSPIMLQAEKCMKNGILINKKRYIFMKYEGVNDKGKILAKGVETARRDNCQMVVDCMNQMVDQLFAKGDKKAAQGVLDDTLRNLMAGTTDIGKLVISKAISKDSYHNEPPHVAVARKMKARDPSYEAGPAERIPFVIVSNGGKNVTEKAEDPLWSIKQQIPLDLDYYIQQQLAGPVARILMWIYASGQDLHSVRKAENHLREIQDNNPDDFVRVKKAKDGLVKEIDLMKKHTISRFFGPAALSRFPRKIQSTAGKKGAIDSFFKQTKTATHKRGIDGEFVQDDPPLIKKCSRCQETDLVSDDAVKVLLCPKCDPKCIRCTRLVQHSQIVDGNICISCAEHRCYACNTPLPAEVNNGETLCKNCEARVQVRKKHKISIINETTDIEDLVKQAAEAKLKCDKCRGYADETEIRCVQKDCLNLYKRATLEMRIKNIVH
jgi:DNA polymerase delta subunit 1